MATGDDYSVEISMNYMYMLSLCVTVFGMLKAVHLNTLAEAQWDLFAFPVTSLQPPRGYHCKRRGGEMCGVPLGDMENSNSSIYHCVHFGPDKSEQKQRGSSIVCAESDKRKRELVLSIFTTMVHQGYQHQVSIGIG